MNQPIYFTLSDIGLALLLIAGLVLIVYLIITLININKTIKNVNIIIDENRTSVKNALTSVPEICENVNEITANVKGKVEAVDSFFEAKEETASTFDIQSIVSYAATAYDIVSQIKNMFAKKKKRKLKRYM